jgi:hypothetical protein
MKRLPALTTSPLPLCSKEIIGELTEELRRWAAAGILSGTDPVRQVEVIGEKVVPAVADV